MKANACAAGISKALAGIKGKGFGSYPDAEPGTRAYDIHYAYYSRFWDLDRLRSAVLHERDPESFAFRLNEDECKAVAAGEDIRIEPTVIEKSEPRKPRPLTYEESVAKAHEDAARANAQIDRAMDDMLENYRRKAVSSKTHASGGSRADIFEMPDGTIVSCRTTFKNALL